MFDMFKRKTIPERKRFLLTKDQIIEDILKVIGDEDQRNKLYYCLDEKPPQEYRFPRMEEFLKGTDNLENVSGRLANMTDEVESMTGDISKILNKIKSKSTNSLTDLR